MDTVLETIKALKKPLCRSHKIEAAVDGDKAEMYAFAAIRLEKSFWMDCKVRIQDICRSAWNWHNKIY